ncbi:response regulator [Clavibacter michiganensis]|uniref:response regulator n=1 Tax=Clavibacter michiganensis TaxID=28447 RepID=UPI003EBC693E
MIPVLIVDDDFMVAAAHRRVVEGTPGFEVVGSASTGAEALERIGRLRPQLVLLDIYLPDLPGTEVLREVRAAQPDVDFIVLSAAREPATVTTALQGGVVSYLSKPFTIEALRTRLESYAVRSRMLARRTPLGQGEIDSLFPTGGPAASTATLPKGLSQETARLVASLLDGAAPDLSADDCAQALGLSRVAVRSYLEHFVARELAEVQLRYGRAGRPQRRYRWKEPRHPGDVPRPSLASDGSPATDGAADRP